LVKKASIFFLLLTGLWSCATYQAPPPSLYIGSLPPSIVAELTLEERILAEEVWTDLKQGRGSRAEKTVSRLGMDSPIYNVSLGYINFLMSKLQSAEKFFRRALEERPELALAHAGLAQIYQKSGRDDQAFAAFREVLKTEPENPWAKQQYETLKNRKMEEIQEEAKTSLTEGDIKRAKAALLKALYYSPQHTESHLTLADIYIKENKLQNALVHLKAASTSEPGNKEILKKYADTLSLAGQHTKSLAIYEQLQKLDPENKEAQDQIQGLRKRLGIFELPSKYESIPSSDAITRQEMAALLAVKFKGIVDEMTDSPPIIIDISASWASKFILQITSLQIMGIYPNHTFQPKKTVTRAEMANILSQFIIYLVKKGYKFIQQIPPDRIEISDVSLQNYYYQPILKMLSYNIMELSLDRTFEPDSTVSGEEAIKLLDIILALIK
jgi:tetratricopeptide (TPR) repeat protein